MTPEEKSNLMFETMKLSRLLQSHRIRSTHLDDLIRDIMEKKASDLNNEGLQAQVMFVLEEWGPETFTSWIKDCHEQGLLSDPNDSSSDATEPVQNVITIDGIKNIRFKADDRMSLLSIDDIINEYIKPALYQLHHEKLKEKIEDSVVCTEHKCGSRNVSLIDKEQNGSQQWECHDCGTIFYVSKSK